MVLLYPVGIIAHIGEVDPLQDTIQMSQEGQRVLVQNERNPHPIFSIGIYNSLLNGKLLASVGVLGARQGSNSHPCVLSSIKRASSSLAASRLASSFTMTHSSDRSLRPLYHFETMNCGV